MASRDSKRWFQRIGPGLITACVVIGPGSILTSSKVGASQGYALSWVVLVAALFMMLFTSLGAKLGAVAPASPADLIRDRAGRWLAICIGIGVFFISAAFQFGNNLGVHAAFKEFADYLPKMGRFDIDYVIVCFNLLTISFLFAFRNLYRALERLMTLFVGLMLLAFAINLIFARPSVIDILEGCIPPIQLLWSGSDDAGQSLLDLSLLGLVGTTFVITASYYQAYLVRQKGWGKAELKDGVMDARVGAIIMAMITLMLMTTAAARLQGQALQNVGDVAAGLRPAFGALGHSLFCLGLFSAAYSSFMVNSMIGGFILADGLGLGSKPDDFFPRFFTVAALLSGMAIAWLVIRVGLNPIPAIVAAQAVTVVAAPLVAAALIWLTSSKKIMGDQRNSALTNIAAAVGLLLLLLMAWYTATTIIPQRWNHWRESTSQKAVAGTFSQRGRLQSNTPRRARSVSPIGFNNVPTQPSFTRSRRHHKYWRVWQCSTEQGLLCDAATGRTSSQGVASLHNLLPGLHLRHVRLCPLPFRSDG